jgi:peroxiredoxin
MERSRTADIIALVIVLVIGAPFVYMMASAFADGEVRRREGPLRALLGGETYDTLLEDRDPPQHYLQRPPVPAWLTIFPRNRGLQDRSRDRRAPDFSLPSSEGGTWRMQDHRGKVVVMNFWTVTCGPCMEEMPSLRRLANVLRERDDVELVTISVDGDWETVRRVVPEDDPLEVLLDPEKQVVRQQFGTRLYPETWIIDPDGIIRLRVDGQRDWSSPVVLDVIDNYF